MPEEFDPEKLEGREEVDPYIRQGGRAIQPKSAASGSGLNPIEEGAKKVTRLAAAELTGGASEAARKIPGVGKLIDAATDKLAKYFTKNFWKTLIVANWPTILTIGVVIILLFAILVPAFGGMAKARRGAYGGTPISAVALASSSDVAEVQEVLGNSITVPGDPTIWYWNQGDRNSDWRDVHLKGWSTGKTFANVGCGITSAAMIAKYYGVPGVSPRVFGELVVSQTGNAQGGWREELATYTNRNLVDVPENLASIKAEIAAGNPVLARGEKAFGSKDGHFVVIIGVSKDDRFLVLNDPSPSERGRPARYSPASELGSSITGLWAYHVK